jgi:hypothetical protein
MKGSSGICKISNTFVGNHVEKYVNGKSSSTSCNQVLINAPSEPSFKRDPVQFDCLSDRSVAAAFDKQINDYKCCGKGPSKCYRDWSNICADPTKWSPGTIPKDIPLQGKNINQLSCSDLVWFMYINYKTYNLPDLSDLSKLKTICHDGKHDTEANLVELFISTGGCCGSTGKSICFADKAPSPSSESESQTTDGDASASVSVTSLLNSVLFVLSSMVILYTM